MFKRNRQEPLYDAGFSIFDTVLEKVSLTVGQQPVETGGALLGDYTSGVINDFIFDEDAETTSVSYIPSRRLVERVNVAESRDRLQFKGVLHSHPGNFDVPSGPDANSFFEGLRANPELSRYLAPIVTFQPGEDIDNKISLPGGGWITFYVALRESKDSVRIKRTMPDVIHFGRDCRSITMLLGLPTPQFLNDHNGTNPVVTAVMNLTDDSELMLTADGSYPENPPRALLHNKKKNQTKQLTLRWSIAIADDLRLVHSLADISLQHDSYPTSLAFGLHGIPMTKDETRALELKLDPVFVGESFTEKVEGVETGLFARSKGILSETLRNRHVLINGAGSVGSYIAEQLVRSGVGSVTLLDPDTVEYSNLSRTNYVSSDVGSLKIDALSRRLLSISPTLNTFGVGENLHDLTTTQLDELFTKADIVICAVDDRRAQLLINHWAYHYKKPAVFIGIFAGAKSGEVCWIDPPLPCYQCVTQFREVLSPDAIRPTDYGTGQLVAEVALGIDIQAITTIGIRLCLSALVRNQECSLANYVNELGKKQYVVLAVDPEDQHISPYFDSNTPGQYGHKSLWMQPSKNDQCNVCGPNPDIPRATISPTPSQIREAILKNSRMVETTRDTNEVDAPSNEESVQPTLEKSPSEIIAASEQSATENPRSPELDR